MLCDVATYRRLTGDRASDANDITEAIADAQADVQNFINRPANGPIEQTTVTETLRLYRGIVFPTVTPLVSVSDPAGAVIDGASIVSVGGVVQTGIGFLTGYAPDDNLYPLRATVTYVGGWTATQGQANTVPLKVQRGIALLAQLQLAGVGSSVPVGATSVRSGDVSIAFRDPQTPMQAREAVLKSIDGYRYRPAVP